ncbi:MAG: ribosomal protein S18-alanine N-acetyltransferase [Clostridia bacterium]|nr:ribosomal protein S18-alanine N-acetyltransferase [Clostridia bacterium]
MSADYMLRPMCREDLDGMLDVEHRSFSIPWTKGMFEDELFNPNAYYLVLKADGRIVGYGGLWKILDEGHITNVAVHPDYRRHGFGKALIQGLIDFANTNGLVALTLEVRVSNAPAIALYESFGFRSQGKRKRYYPDNHEDALIMWLNL